MQAWIDRELPVLRAVGAPIFVSSEIPATDASRDFRIAIVVNRPSDHYSMSTRLLKSGYHVLVEKPFTVDPLHAAELVRLGQATRKIVAAGLVFRHASYLDIFCLQLPFAPSEANEFELFWWDPAEEIRYGEIKRVPTDISLVMDVLPHAWSILDRVFGEAARISMQLGKLTDSNSSVEVLASAGSVVGKIRLSRPAPVRRRLFRISAGNMKASLDFTGDPVLIQFNENTPMRLPVRSTHGGPLARMLRSFLVLAASEQSSAASAVVEARDAPLVGDRIVSHTNLLAGIDREFRDRQKQ
jgi:hypothetical protein